MIVYHRVAEVAAVPPRLVTIHRSGERPKCRVLQMAERSTILDAAERLDQNTQGFVGNIE